MAETRTDKLTPKQEQFIEAMLTLPSIAQAAEAIGMHKNTCERWMRQEHVREAFSKARKEAFHQSLARLTAGIDKALDVLDQAMTDESAPQAVRVRAAQLWIEQALQTQRLNEIEETNERITELVQSLEKRL